MYILRKTKHTTTLVEMTTAEYNEAITAEHSSLLGTDDHVTHTRITSEQARRYVKDGGTHETGLWVDGGKVRYAPPNS